MEIENKENDNSIFCGIDIRGLPLIGEGRQGRVYLLPDGMVIKVYKNRYSCSDQNSILHSARESGYFPKVYSCDDDSIIMEYIDGVPLNKYLKYNRLNKKIAHELVKMIVEFKRLGFTRLDIRILHIFVQADETIRVIDPRRSYKINQLCPCLMLRGLREYGALNDFFDFIKDEYRELADEWKRNCLVKDKKYSE